MWPRLGQQQALQTHEAGLACGELQLVLRTGNGVCNVVFMATSGMQKTSS